MTMPDTTGRPRPLRIAGAVIGGLLALVNGLVGAGLFTTAQGDATTATINAIVTLLAVFGCVAVAERHVTPLDDPRDYDGTPLVTVQPTTEHPDEVDR
ncbi:hypothetical protein [Alloactinosynnema sp. L-07]|uniref:hypothetical protein n=1 Tax=Alloactinosynnema sp. L-07 TaxID=1653480 RepID=UPI00065EF642|nr:hypothetical protein [Alloactinosynnema sp. L-07]CRK55417.1 hypothetical protein [Alloactinosynnema sp. L-07]